MVPKQNYSLFTKQPRHGNNIKCPMTNEQIKKMWYTYIQWNTIQPQEIRDSSFMTIR